jgi:Rieske Fe-S protein
MTDLGDPPRGDAAGHSGARFEDHPTPEDQLPPDLELEEAMELESRRSFVKKLGIGAVAGAIGVTVAGPAFRYLAGTGIEGSSSDEWIPLGVASAVPLGEPTLFKSSVERKAGWIVTRSELSVYVVTEDGVNFTAFSNVCTHLGCRVRWVTEQESYFCPCHNAVFGRDGAVVAGPPPAPLDQFEVMVEEGQLMIREA